MKAAAAVLGLAALGGAFARGGPTSRPPAALDFTYDVLPILQRHGCASAYCHGSATGRADFKLSLFGGDAAADWRAIAAEFRGRRLDRREPAQSLLVQKALGRLDHGGGRRLVRDGAAHRRLLAWIDAGAPWRAGPERVLQDLRAEVRGERVAAVATFRGADGEVAQDVSDVALFASTDPTVVDVDADGNVRFTGSGRAHVTVRYCDRTAVVPFVRGFGETPPACDGAHELDRAWCAHLAQLGLAPAPAVPPQQLARRLHLDFVGRPPTPAELDTFVAAPDVAATVARLVARREFAAVWGAHLARWFEVGDREGAADAFASALARGDDLPAIARRVVRGELGGLDRVADPRDRAEYAGRTLLGLRIGCARCHDHPADRWRQSEHQAFGACFAPPRPDGAGGAMAGAMFDADSGERIAPHFLDLAAAATTGIAAPAGAITSRDAIAAFVLDERHDAFARNAANRVFALLLGRGLVEPLDDHRPGNPPRAAAVLDALVAAFHRGGGRLADLCAFVATSRLYALQCAPDDGPAATWLAAATSRPLAPPAYARALAAVVGRAPDASLPGSPLARELALRNGPYVHSLLAAGGTTIDATFDLCNTADERLAELWRTVLSRAPRADEIERFRPFAAQDVAAFRDLAWALLTGREFGHRR